MDQIHQFTIDWKSGLLTSHNSQVQLEPKLVAVLKVLFEAKGELVSYEDIQSQVWQDVVVAPNALQRVITQLRKHLQDSAKLQKVIKTHPKRGYSLVPSTHQEPRLSSPAAEPINKPQFPKSVLVTLAVLCLIGVISSLILSFYPVNSEPASNGSDTPLVVTNMNSLDTQTSQFRRHLALGENKFIFFDESTKQLVLHDTLTNQRQVLIDNVWLHGGLWLDHVAQELYFDQIQLNQDIKCSSLQRLTLATLQKQELLPCDQLFNHSPKKISKDTLIYIKTDKNWRSTLHLLNERTKKSQKILIANNPNVLKIELAPVEKQLEDHTQTSLAIRTDNEVLLGLLQGDKLTIEGSLKPDETTSPAFRDFKWLDQTTLLLSDGQRLFRYQLITKQLQRSNVISNKEMIELSAAQQKVFAVLNQPNWQPTLTRLTSSENNQFIAPSKFVDHLGQFRPSTGDISLLTDRSGTAQVWLLQNGLLTQFTKSETDVESYLWISEEELVYLTRGNVWQQTLNTPAIRVNQTDKVIDLLQSVGSQLLVKSVRNGTPRLQIITLETPHELSLNTNNNVHNDLYIGDFHWAQYVDENTLIINTNNRLQRLVNGRPVDLKFMSDVILQWHYYLRGGLVYVQGKDQNVWQINPITEQRSVVGRYDLRSLQMTDYQPDTKQLISNYFVNDEKELVNIEFH